MVSLRGINESQNLRFARWFRWGDRANQVDEASLIHLSRSGSVLNERYLSAGFSVQLNGMTEILGHPVAYGSLGGMPAATIQQHH
jgi:hypothetical protein